jgi:hypothetical protein
MKLKKILDEYPVVVIAEPALASYNGLPKI